MVFIPLVASMKPKNQYKFFFRVLGHLEDPLIALDPANGRNFVLLENFSLGLGILLHIGKEKTE